jgi:DNA-binding MurR/RpiR family transcriptional regulator
MVMNKKIESYKNLIEYLEINFETFTHTQKHLTNYLLSNINDVAFLTADEIAEKVNTTPSSVVRFAKQIGYRGYPELQKDLQNLIIDKISVVEELETYKKFDSSKAETAIKLSLKKDLSNINNLIKEINENSIIEFVNIIISSRKKYIIANRSGLSLGHFFFFQLKKMIFDVFLLSNYDDGVFDVLRELAPEDVILAISFPRFTKLTINFAQYAKKGGVKLISITDKKTSPLYKISDVCLFCPYESSAFFNSNVASMALINAILSEMFNQKHNLTISNLKKEAAIRLKLDLLRSKG